MIKQNAVPVSPFQSVMAKRFRESIKYDGVTRPERVERDHEFHQQRNGTYSNNQEILRADERRWPLGFLSHEKLAIARSMV